MYIPVQDTRAVKNARGGSAVEAYGEYITVTGTLPEGSWEDDSIIYIVCGDLCYEASPYSVIDTGEEGFTALLEKNDVSTDNIKVFID